MKRRQFLQAAGLAATAIATPAIAQTNPAIKWRLTSSMPKSLDTLYGASETISKFVGEASDHQFQIQPFAAEWVGPYDDEKLGFSKVAKYYYYPGWWEGGFVNHLMINLEKWNELPKRYQSIFAGAAAYANTEAQAKYDARNPAAMRRLIAGGTEFKAFSQPVMEACLKASNEVNAETAARNADFKKVLDSMQAFRNDGYFWWQVAEYSYDTFMIRSRTRT
jgi:TRAP-type mannitol/chloroaromatic compound transport system substrate-binding protein